MWLVAREDGGTSLRHAVLVQTIRYALVFAAIGTIFYLAWISFYPHVAREAVLTPIDFAYLVLVPLGLRVLWWAPVEWIREHPYLLRTLIISSNAAFYASVGAWLSFMRSRHWAFRFGVPVAIWAAVVAAPWVITLYIAPWVRITFWEWTR